MTNLIVPVLAILPTVLWAENVTYTCPASIQVASNGISLPKGWESLNRNEGKAFSLEAAYFTDGHPREMAELKPWNGDVPVPPKGEPNVIVYKFPAEYPEGIWLVCSYKNTTTALYKRVEETPRSCEVVYPQKPFPAPVLESIRCR